MSSSRYTDGNRNLSGQGPWNRRIPPSQENSQDAIPSRAYRKPPSRGRSQVEEHRRKTPHQEYEKSSDRTTGQQELAYSHPSSSSEHTHLCDYCGDEIVGNHVEDCDRQRQRCEEAVAVFKKHFSDNKYVLSIAIHVHFLCGLTDEEGKDRKDHLKKIKRAKKLEELIKIVSAIRNSNSGHIVIHLVGLAEDDSYTGKFDEFADYKLEGLLDGSLFTDVYKKNPLSKYAEYETDKDLKQTLKGFNDFLVLYVEGSENLITSNFNTKHPLDDGILDSTREVVLKLLKKRKPFTEKFSAARQKIEEVLILQESRSVQLKGYDPAKESEVFRADILFKNRLAEYISAFTKCDEGGSFFFAVREKPYHQTGTTYPTIRLEAQQVLVKDQNQAVQDIKAGVRDSILVCDYDGTVLSDIDTVDIVRVYFVTKPDTEGDRRASGSSTKNCVVCVQARPVRGIVFCDKEGPLAYKVTDSENQISRYSFEDWFKIFMNQQENNVTS